MQRTWTTKSVWAAELALVAWAAFVAAKSVGWLGLIRLGGHFPKGGYGVQHGRGAEATEAEA